MSIFTADDHVTDRSTERGVRVHVCPRTAHERLKFCDYRMLCGWRRERKRAGQHATAAVLHTHIRGDGDCEFAGGNARARLKRHFSKEIRACRSTGARFPQYVSSGGSGGIHNKPYARLGPTFHVFFLLLFAIHVLSCVQRWGKRAIASPPLRKNCVLHLWRYDTIFIIFVSN